MYRLKQLIATLTLSFLALSLSSLQAAESDRIRICIDESFWYPFTLVRNGQPAGIHVELVKLAIENVGMEAKFLAMPWKRCLRENEQGRVDAVVSASYKAKRAKYLYFPDDAALSKKSPLRLMQIEYVVVTLKKDHYTFTGNLSTLPVPVRIPAGYSLADDLKKKGINVDDSSQSDTANIQKLVRDKEGSVVLIPELATLLDARVANKGKLDISKIPISSKSYYVAFSKKTKIAKKDIQSIWARVAELRDNPSLMAELSAHY